MNRRGGATSELDPGGYLVAHSPIDGSCATPSSRRLVAIDLGFIIGLLAISAAPLVLLRGNDLLHDGGFLAATFVAWFGYVALWTIVVDRMGAGRAGATDIAAPRHDPRESRSRLLLAAALLFAFAATVFFLPLRLHFWGGYDDFVSLIDRAAVIWSDAVDTKMGRPLLGMQSLIAALLTPDRIEGVLYVAAGLCFVNALLLMGIIRRLLPGGVLIGMAAAVLFVVNRSEPLIFFVAWATNFYWMALFWFLLSLYLLLVSHIRKSRWLLAVSCGSLGAALLTSEGLFPLTLVGPLLLYFQRDARSRLLVWTSAWFGTVALFAIRFATYFLGGVSYQGKILGTAHLQDILVHAGQLLLGIRSYFSVPGSLPEHWGFWLLGFGLAAAALASVQDLARPVRPGICLAGMATAALANILAIAPFAPLATEWRTQYFAGAAQAVFVAFGIALLASVIWQRFGRFAAIMLSTLIAANAAAQAWSSQESTRSTVRFEKTVHVFKQVHAIAPNLPDDTLLVFFLEDGSDPPLGVNYHVLNMSGLVLGVTALQMNFSDPHGMTARFGKDDIEVSIWNEKVLRYRYDQVVAFRLSGDGTVALLDHLPESSSSGPVTGYAPFARLAAGPVGELRFLRYLSSSERAVDVFDTETGIMFGRNWGELVDVGGQVGRWADNDAELIVNPAGRDRLELRFELDPRGMFLRRASELVVLGASGEVLASALLQSERPQVRLEAPLTRDQVTPLRLRIREVGDARHSPPRSFLVVSSEHKVAARWQRSAGSDGIEPSDIATPADRVHLGGNWHPLESQAGESFRWVTNDAEILVDAAPDTSAVVRLDLEGGPSFGGKPADLRILGEDGSVLAEAAVLGRRTIDVALPPAAQRRRLLRLHVEGGGLPIPDDPRILNLRVFRSWRPADIDAPPNIAVPGDIVTPADRLHLGGNWHQLESQAGQSFRWVTNDAEILVEAAPDASAVVRLDLEGGPSFGGKPADLRILAEDGSVLAEAAVLGRRTIDVEIAPAAQRRRVLRLHVEGGGLPMPDDPRILNLRVFRSWRPADIDAPPNIAVPGDIVTPADRLHLGGNWHQLESQAGQSFRWVTNDAEILVEAAPDASAVVRLDLEGGPSFGGKPAALRILGEDGSVLADAAVLGRRTIDVELPPAPQRRRVLRLHVEGGGLPVPNDPRILNLRIFRSWRPADIAAPPDIAVPADIVTPADRLHLGRNWHQLESQAGQSFRWVTNDAEILVDAAPDTSAVVRLDLEGGPSFGGKPADLRILAEDGSVLADAAVLGRRIIDVELPPAPQRRRVLRLHVEGGGLPIPKDPRILNLRVFRSWRPADIAAPGDIAAPANIPVPADIVTPADRLHLGGNWHQLESQAGELFRWAANDAEILVDAAPDTSAVVRLDLEGGPSFGGKPADLRILAEDGSVLAEAAVLGRRTIDVELPPVPQRRRVLRLHVEGGGLPIPNDPRILNFRIFRSWRVGVIYYDRQGRVDMPRGRAWISMFGSLAPRAKVDPLALEHQRFSPDLGVDRQDILAQQPDDEQLDTPEKEQRHDNGRNARGRQLAKMDQ